MNLSPRWVGLLSEAGFEAVHWSTIGEADARDAQIMAWAAGGRGRIRKRAASGGHSSKVRNPAVSLIDQLGLNK